METNKKILIVDDEIDLLEMIAFQFKSMGFEVKTAANGLEALGKVHLFRPDLIILDMNMPGMGGIEFYSNIADKDGKSIYPVLVLTARANVEGLFKGLEIDGFMIKPFEIDQLVAKAESIIKNKSTQTICKRKDILGRPRKICIVENDQGIFDHLSGTFLNAGYTVTPARTGTQAIEKMIKDTPDIALVQLGLKDVPGDDVIFRLSQMAKTMDVKFILYTSRDIKHDRQVMERISAKTGILTFVEYRQLDDLLITANHLST